MLNTHFFFLLWSHSHIVQGLRRTPQTRTLDGGEGCSGVEQGNANGHRIQPNDDRDTSRLIGQWSAGSG